MAGPIRLGGRGRGGPISRHRARIGIKSPEKPSDNQLRRVAQRRNMRVAVHMLAQECLQKRGFGAHRGRKRDKAAPGGAHIGNAARRGFGDPAARFAEQIVGHPPDLLAHQFGHQPPQPIFGARRHPRPARRDRCPACRRERHSGGHRLDAEQPGADAIIQIVIVIGDIIGERRHLRLQPGMAGQIERPGSIGFGQRPGRQEDRAIMLGKAFQRLPAQVEAIPARVAAFQPGNDAQRLGIVIEAAIGNQRRFKCILTRMAEWWVAEIMRQRQRLGQVLIEPQCPRQRAGDLGDFEAVGQPDPEMVAIRSHEHLGLVAQAAKGARMDDAVAITLEGRAGGGRRLGVAAAT